MLGADSGERGYINRETRWVAIVVIVNENEQKGTKGRTDNHLDGLSHPCYQ